MHTPILYLLSFFARSIVNFHKPIIIGITGTVGKTTVTAHIHAFFERVFPHEKIGYSPDHYNGEYGVPLTIIGAKTGGKNPLKWFWVFCIAISRFFRPYPKYLILEYGLDHPGEMNYMLDIAVPTVAIITEITPNHIEQFGTFDRYKSEKLQLVTRAGELIVHDSLRDSIEREAIYYGTGAMSDIDASHIEITPDGTSAQVHFAHRDYDLGVRAFGGFHIVNLLPLYALCEIFSLPVGAVAEYARLSHSEPGRSRILNGVHNSTIIDGSYNGGYLALHGGINSMHSFLHSHRLFFLIGDMRELGEQTEPMHKKLAEEILDMFGHSESNIEFFLVGPYMQDYVYPVISKRFSTKKYLSSRKAAQDIRMLLSEKKTENTMIYVKGSQNTIFLEEAIVMLLEDPVDQDKLCRQSSDWKIKKENFFKNLEKSTPAI